MSRPNVAPARRPGHARAVRWRALDARPWGPGAGVVSPRQRIGGRAAQSERRAGTPAVGRVASLVAVISAGLDLITVLVGFVVIEVGAAKLFSNSCSVFAAPRGQKVINELVAQHPSSNHALLQPRPPPTTPSSNHALLQPPPPPTTPSSNHAPDSYANGDKTEMTSPAPAGQSGYETTTYVYDAAGNLKETVAPPTSDAAGAPDEVTYDTYNADGERRHRDDRVRHLGLLHDELLLRPERGHDRSRRARRQHRGRRGLRDLLPMGRERELVPDPGRPRDHLQLRLGRRARVDDLAGDVCCPERDHDVLHLRPGGQQGDEHRRDGRGHDLHLHPDRPRVVGQLLRLVGSSGELRLRRRR